MKGFFFCYVEHGKKGIQNHIKNVFSESSEWKIKNFSSLICIKFNFNDNPIKSFWFSRRGGEIFDGLQGKNLFLKSPGHHFHVMRFFGSLFLMN